MLETVTEDIENSFDLLNYIQHVLKPTKNDLERVITKKEQIELCLKHKCRVDMWRWNPVYEYRLAFEDKGRFNKWTDKKRLKMLAKSVKMMMPNEFCSDEEIVKIRKKEWEIQKKDSILSLNLWASERKNKEKEPERLEAEQQSNSILVCDRVSTSHDITDILDLLDDIDIGTDLRERQPADCPSTSDEISQTILNTQKAQEKRPVTNLCEEEIDTILNLIFSEFESSDHGTSSNNQIHESKLEPQEKQLDTAPDGNFHTNLDFSIQQGQSEVIAKSVDIDPQIDILFDVNTESMSVDSQFSTESQMAHLSERDNQLSQRLPPNYKHFNNDISLSSTII